LREKEQQQKIMLSLFLHYGLNPFSSQQMEDNKAPPALNFHMILFSLHTPPHIHRQNPDRGHVHAAPVICQLITCLSTARRETKRRETRSSASPEFVFLSSGRTYKLDQSGSVLWNQGPLPKGRTALMTQSLPLPFPEARPFPLTTRRRASHAQTLGQDTEGVQGQVDPQSWGQKTEAG
jgi:hypothetical protein